MIESRMYRRAALLLALALPGTPLLAQEPAADAAQKGPEQAPWIVRWMVHPRKRGLFLNIPTIDTDPNRGTTYGIMPIWVVQGEHEDRITQIHAPSFTYNKDFGFVPTYRYYYYPATDSTFVGRGSFSQHSEREALLHFKDRTLLGSKVDFSLRTQYNVDGSNRFFGLGPASSKDKESVYTEDVLQYELSAGLPLGDTRWMAHASNRFAGEKIYDGKIPSLPNIGATFPGIVPSDRQKVNESRFTLTYDARDDANTTRSGSYLETYAGFASDQLASDFSYDRYGIDGRYFHPWGDHPDWVTAAQYKYEQLLGDAPFWLLPRLGGKYSLRAYGEGRYVDRCAMFSTVEQRFTVYKERMAGVSMEFELAPFAGLGTVADNPQRVARRYARPVLGLATRAVARPQVVGSIDVGVGQEGVAIFMDINYSF